MSSASILNCLVREKYILRSGEIVLTIYRFVGLLLADRVLEQEDDAINGTEERSISFNNNRAK